MRSTACVRTRASILAFGIFTVLHTGCKPKTQPESSEQNASMGLAQHVFYQCSSATEKNGVKYSYQVSTLNNTTPEVSLQIDPSNSPTLIFSELKKNGTDKWSDSSKYTLTLTNKNDGSKGILVQDYRLGVKVNPENSFCNLVCSGPTKWVDGRCLWTGATEESVIGNMIIETVATAGLGTVWRAAMLSRSLRAASSATAVADARATVLVLDSPLRTGAQKIAAANSFDEAMAHLSKSLQKTNPLSGTPAVGKGNCANDAMTQLVSMVLGRWACAIPYPKGQLGYSSMKSISDDLTRLVGVKERHAVENLAEFSSTTLAKKMGEGEIAFLFSKGAKAGHATLIAKIKGQFVHINNQNWPQKFQSIGDWDTLWRATYGGNSPQYQILILSKKMIGF